MSQNTKVVNQKKPYCKVCQDAGKPESIYTSHWVKSLPDKNGQTKTICPTLLDTECRYCFKLGHTTKFCPVLEKANKKRTKNDIRNQFNKDKDQFIKNAKPVSNKKVSCFDALDLGSDSDPEEEEKVSFPILVTKPQSNTALKSETLTGWAAIAAKPQAEKVNVFGCTIDKPNVESEGKAFDVTIINKPKLVRQVATTYDMPTKIAPWAKPDNKVTANKSSWADYSESETEDETDNETEDETW